MVFENQIANRKNYIANLQFGFAKKNLFANLLLVCEQPGPKQRCQKVSAQKKDPLFAEEVADTRGKGDHFRVSHWGLI